MQSYKINRFAVPITEHHHDAMNRSQRAMKRFFDIFFSASGLVLLSPLIIFIWFVLLFDKGPIIYKQERIGYRGRPFTIYKFRSMRVDSEANGIPRLEEERSRYLTSFGRFLLVHHLDELPQLWNVIKGDMSIVGPRPERQYFIDQIDRETDEYHYIYLMRPGLTSYATIHNGYTDTMDKMLKRLELDLDYLDNRSLLLDLRIFLRTVWLIFTGKKF